ncbi:MAG TPA: hypothetical protein VFA45_19635 [Actinomycetes bacterium]|nr:hypothetical protein [Actinomycetes bacterium]
MELLEGWSWSRTWSTQPLQGDRLRPLEERQGRRPDLAQLLRADLLPEAWIAPQPVRDQRALLRHRVSLVRLSTASKNRVHAVLADRGVREHTSLWTAAGRAWLATLDLPPVPRQIVDDCCS